MQLGVDIGGTCTDFVVARDGALHLYKTPTTPDDPVAGVINGMNAVAGHLDLSPRELLAGTDLVVHGTTLATNALVTGSTARTAFLTTKGHPDILVLREAGRMGLPTFGHAIRYPEPYVPRALTFEVPERIDALGAVVCALDEAAVLEILEHLRRDRVKAVAVCLLWSIANPAHERRVGELIAQHLPGVAVSLSHEVNPCLREFRRAAATCIDASLKPLTASYLERMESALSGAGLAGRLLISTSTGTVVDARRAVESPIHLVRSGPALGPVAASRYAEADLGSELAVVIDAGGTTFDVSVIRDGAPALTRETWIGTPCLGHMTGFASIDVRSIGAGGGTIAGVDPAGLLRLGPHSAGAEPGPACYGHGGTRATVTDAAIMLGFINPRFFMGCAASLDVEAAGAALRRDVGGPLGIGDLDAAEAVLRVFVEDMAVAIEDMTLAEGLDPRQAVLVATGGAAGFAAVFLARRLGCGRILVPPTAPVNCAAGGLLADIHRDFTRVCVQQSSAFDPDAVSLRLAELREQGRAFLGTLSERVEDWVSATTVEAKYEDQNWEIEVPVPSLEPASTGFLPALVASFHEAHQRLYRHHDPDADIHFLTWRTRVTLRRDRGSPPAVVESADVPGATKRRTKLPGDPVREVPVIPSASLDRERVTKGPLVVQAPLTSVVLDRAARAQRSRSGSIIIEVDELDGEKATEPDRGRRR